MTKQSVKVPGPLVIFRLEGKLKMSGFYSVFFSVAQSYQIDIVVGAKIQATV